jgi:hypothetical protein
MTTHSGIDEKGIKPCRTWESQPDTGDRIVWSVDSRDGVIQGPLDFQFLHGKKILLQLESHQIALLTHAGELSAVFLEGTHPLSIGTRPEQIPPTSELIFLAVDHPLTFTWDSETVLRIPAQDGQTTTVPIHGSCICHVNGPAQFFAAFLRNSSDVGEPFTLRVMDALVRASLEKTAAAALGGQEHSQATLEPYFESLTPQLLTASLQELGLHCSELKVRLAPDSPSPQTSSTGQSTSDRVNRG